MLKLGPVSVVRGPTVPSVFTWASAQAGTMSSGNRRSVVCRQHGVIVSSVTLTKREQFRAHIPCSGAGAPEDIGGFAGLLLVDLHDGRDRVISLRGSIGQNRDGSA